MKSYFLIVKIMSKKFCQQYCHLFSKFMKVQSFHNCIKILQQYKIVFVFLTIFTATLNLSGMISVIFSWKKSTRYKFPENAFRKSSSGPEESVSLVSNKETYV